MPLYFGLPLTCQEAFRLFDLDFEQVKFDIIEKHKLRENMYMDCYFVDHLNCFFKREALTMKTFYTDKGQCIIGYELARLSGFQRNLINVSDFITLLETFKSSFAREIEKYKENFREVALEHMEDEPETVSFPEPYIIEFNK
jgi:hypothetical protein